MTYVSYNIFFKSVSFSQLNHTYKNIKLQFLKSNLFQMNFPAALKYTKDHEWVKLDGDVCVIGISDYAQGELGDIIYLDITSDTGSDVKMGDVIGSIEAVKTVSEVYSPVSGNIIEVNTGINDNPSIVNTDPYNDGWIIKIRPSNMDEINNLMDSEAYKALIGV